MPMSAAALDLMQWLTDKYAETTNGNYKVWSFTPQRDDPRIVELVDHGLIRPLASRWGPYRLTDRGHQWVLDNRRIAEDPMDAEFEEMAFSDTFVIRGAEFFGQREAGKDTALIACDGEPHFQPGDVIQQKSGRSMVELRIVDASFAKGGTLGMSRFPDLLTLVVENITAAQHKRTQGGGGGINVGSITAAAVLVGDGSVQAVNVTLQDLVQQVSKTGDPEAKGLLAKVFSNPTVSSVLGAGATELLKKILGG